MYLKQEYQTMSLSFRAFDATQPDCDNFCELCYKITDEEELNKYDDGLCRVCFYKSKDSRKEAREAWPSLPDEWEDYSEPDSEFEEDDEEPILEDNIARDLMSDVFEVINSIGPKWRLWESASGNTMWVRYSY